MHVSSTALTGHRFIQWKDHSTPAGKKLVIIHKKVQTSYMLMDLIHDSCTNECITAWDK